MRTKYLFGSATNGVSSNASHQLIPWPESPVWMMTSSGDPMFSLKARRHVNSTAVVAFRSNSRSGGRAFLFPSTSSISPMECSSCPLWAMVPSKRTQDKKRTIMRREKDNIILCVNLLNYIVKQPWQKKYKAGSEWKANFQSLTFCRKKFRWLPRVHRLHASFSSLWQIIAPACF